jgi:hypothetical protein
MEAVQTVANFPDLTAAKLAQSLLEAGGIASTIPDEGLAGIDWRMTTALHGIRLQVAADDVDEAAVLLAEAAEVDPGEPGALPDAKSLCPGCGSASVGPAPWKRRLKAVALLLPVVIVAWPLVALLRPPLFCFSCRRSLGDDS